MEVNLLTLVMLPIGLGLLGFIEPCTIGGHLLFLDTQKSRARREKINAVVIFILTRSFVAGMFGAAIAFLGQQLVGFQTAIWLVFGLIYLGVGTVFIIGKANLVKRQIDLAPDTWKRARSPALLGLAFGLNIPACAAPILFGLLGLAATSGTVFTGFVMMFLFGLFLSLPLAFFAMVPGLADRLDGLSHKLIKTRWLIGIVFLALGIWSVWFGLYVDPANWA